MNNILLISEDYLKTNSNLNSNAFGKWVLPAIRESQEMGLMPIIGECLYEKVCLLVENGLIDDDMYIAYKDLLDSKIQPYLLYQTLTNIVPLINSKLANIGTVATNDEHIVNLSQGESDLVQNYYRERADFYAKRLQEWVKSNSQAFPELECDCGKMEPNLHSSANSVGIFLGGRRGKVVSNGDCGCSSKGGSAPVTGDCAGVYLSGYTSGYTKGYDSGYTSGYTDGAETCDCDEAYNEGKADGIAEQKAKLVSTAITSNGTYQREDGFNRVEINVPSTGYTQQDLDNAYDSGYTSGMTSGITSGETRQKAKLATTAFTANGTFQRADGWSAITVDVSGGGGALQYKSVSISETAATITPDSGYVGMSSVDVDASEVWGNGYNSGYTDGYESGYTSGYTSGNTDGYASGYTSGNTDGYLSGYTSGNTDGYSSGYTDGRASVKVETGKSVTVTASTQVISPSSGYDAISDVTVDSSGIYSDGYDTAAAEFGKNFISFRFVPTSEIDDLSGIPYFNRVSPDTEAIDNSGNTVSAFTTGYYGTYGKVIFDTVPAITGIKADGQDVFYLTNVQAINIPEGVVSVSKLSRNNPYLESVNLPISLTACGVDTVCEAPLTYLYIPDAVTQINRYAFQTLYSLDKLHISEATEEIGMYAFSDCFSLKELKIPNSVTTIRHGAFNGCNSLTALTIGSGVTQIEESAFNYNPVPSKYSDVVSPDASSGYHIEEIHVSAHYPAALVTSSGYTGTNPSWFGNAVSSGTLIFHGNGQYYDETEIRTRYENAWFPYLPSGWVMDFIA